MIVILFICLTYGSFKYPLRMFFRQINEQYKLCSSFILPPIEIKKEFKYEIFSRIHSTKLSEYFDINAKQIKICLLILGYGQGTAVIKY